MNKTLEMNELYKSRVIITRDSLRTMYIAQHNYNGKSDNRKINAHIKIS